MQNFQRIVWLLNYKTLFIGFCKTEECFMLERCFDISVSREFFFFYQIPKYPIKSRFKLLLIVKATIKWETKT